MSSLTTAYTEALHYHFGLYATWPIGTPLRLGDYGIRQDGVYQRLGNIEEEFGIPLQQRRDETKDDQEFKSENTQTVREDLSGSATAGVAVKTKAALKISLSGKNSVYFLATDITHRSLENLPEVGNSIMNLFKERRWNHQHVIVTSFQQAKTTTVIVSAGDQASIEIEADNETAPAVNLADVEAGFIVKSESNVAYRLVAKQGVTPLMGLGKVQSKYGPIIEKLAGPLIGKRPDDVPDIGGSLSIWPWLRGLRAMDDIVLKGEEQRYSLDDLFYFGTL